MNEETKCAVRGCERPAAHTQPLSLVDPDQKDPATIFALCNEHNEDRLRGTALDLDETRFFNA